MNDRYLFKAKRKNWQEFPKEEQWVYGYYVRGFNIYEEPIHVILDPTTIFDNSKTDGWDEIDPTTICQCTGLKDKAGNLIWENDVVITNGFAGEIVWCENDTAFLVLPNNDIKNEIYCLGYWLAEYDVEVIGNIFDNPELLEVE